MNLHAFPFALGETVRVVAPADKQLPPSAVGQTLKVTEIGRFTVVSLTNEETGQRYTVAPWEARRCLEALEP